MSVARALAILVACATIAPAAAAPPAWPDTLSPRMQAIKAASAVRLGFREAAVPFSYRAPDGTATGYAIDLCREIVATIEQDLGTPLAVRFVPVTPGNRIAKVVSGEVDLECGATTNTAERAKQVAFSPPIFVAGTRLAVPRGSAVRDAAGLRGKRVAVVSGTTAEATMREVDRLLALRLSIVPAPGYAEALSAVEQGRADAVAADDVLLRGALLESGRSAAFGVVGGLLSLEVYGIAYAPGDAALDDAVSRTFSRLAQSREIAWIYQRWFVRPLPSGQRMDMPMSPQLRRAFEVLGLPAD